MDDSWEKKHRKPHKIFEFCRKNYRKFLQIGARGLSNVSCSKFSITMAIETIEKKISNVEKWKIHQKILARGVIAYNASQSLTRSYGYFFTRVRGLQIFTPHFRGKTAFSLCSFPHPKTIREKGDFTRAHPHICLPAKNLPTNFKFFKLNTFHTFLKHDTHE